MLLPAVLTSACALLPRTASVLHSLMSTELYASVTGPCYMQVRLSPHYVCGLPAVLQQHCATHAHMCSFPTALHCASSHFEQSNIASQCVRSVLRASLHCVSVAHALLQRSAGQRMHAGACAHHHSSMHCAVTASLAFCGCLKGTRDFKIAVRALLCTLRYSPMSLQRPTACFHTQTDPPFQENLASRCVRFVLLASLHCISVAHASLQQAQRMRASACTHFYDVRH